MSAQDQDIAKIAAGLTEVQRVFVLRSRDYPMHPADVIATAGTARSLVRRQLAYTTVCTMTATGETFRGYGLTAAGLAVQSYLQNGGAA